MKKKVRLSVCIICLLLFNACAALPGQENRTGDVSFKQDTLGLTPDFSYEVKEQKPNILIDREGYLPDEKKTAFFIGNDIVGEFYIKEETTGETVYQGVISGTNASIGEEAVSTGDFSAFLEEGNFVIYHEKLGYSYPFTIGKNVYDNVLIRLANLLKTYPYTQVSESAYTLSNVMMTKEIYKDFEPDRVFIQNAMRRLLEAQDEKTGAFPLTYPKQADAETEPEISLSATAETAGVLAQYVFNFKDTDPEFCAECLRAAQKAFAYIEKYRGNISTDSWYFAATQLYRATGGYRYRTAIAEYDSISEASRTISEYDYTILADIAYLSTSYTTDFKRCNAIMERYLDRAQEISLNSLRENFYVLKNADTMSEKELLEDMMILGIVNYVLSGREYAGIQQNYIHYFFGVNAQRRNLLTETGDDGTQETLQDDITKVSEFIFVMGNVLGR